MSNDPSGLFGNFLPNVYIKSIDIFDNHVDLSFSIKEVVLPSGVFGVSSFDFIKKYVKISLSQFSSLSQNATQNINEISIPLNNIDQYDTNFDANNNKEILFNHKFNIDTTNLFTLKYEIRAILDYEQIFSKFGINAINSNTINITKSAIEFALQNSSVPENLYIYRIGDANGQIWYGNVLSPTSKTYTTDEIPSRNLIRQEIPNIKTKDFRQREIRRLAALDSESVANQRNASSIEFLRNKEYNINNLFTNNLLRNLEEKSEIIANTFQMRDSDATISFLFSINYKSLIIKNTQYREILNDLTIPKILNKTQLTRSNLYKKQISDKQTFNKNVKEVFSKVLVGSSAKELNIENINFGTQTNNSLIKNYLISDGNSKIFVDKFSVNNKQGKYEYYLELQFTNGTILYLKEYLEQLISSKNNLLSYYNLTNVAQFFNSRLESFRKSRFIQQQINSFYERYQINTIISLYSDIVSELNNHDSNTKQRNLTIITNYLSPSSATLKSINLFLKLYDKLIAMIQRYCSIKTVAGDAKEAGKISGGQSNIIEIQKNFNDVVNLSNDLVELEYITTNRHIISISDLKSTINRQISYYKTNGNQFNAEANYTFLGPSFIYFNGKKRPSSIGNSSTPSENEDKYFSTLLSEIKLSNKKKDITTNSSLNLNNNQNRQLDNENIKLFFNTLNNLEEDGFTIISENSDPSRSPFITDSRQYYLDIDRAQFLYTQKQIYDSIEEIIDVENTKEPIVLEPSIYSTRYPPFRDGKVPNQIAKAKMDNVDLNKNQNILKYRLLGQIQYLSQIINGQIMWKNLNKTDLENFNTNSLIFARIIFHDYFYNTNIKYQEVNFKIFNQYFFISSTYQ